MLQQIQEVSRSTRENIILQDSEREHIIDKNEIIKSKKLYTYEGSENLLSYTLEDALDEEGKRCRDRR